jgi:hypothetical protein
MAHKEEIVVHNREAAYCLKAALAVERFIPVVMVAHNENLATIQLRQEFTRLSLFAEVQITQVNYQIVLTDDIIPVFQHNLVHFLNRGKRTATVFDDILVTEMGIGDNEYSHWFSFLGIPRDKPGDYLLHHRT